MVLRAGVYILVENGYLFPPPPLGNLHFSPQYTVCESRKIIAWPKGEKIKTLGEKISYIFPQLDFCALFSVTIKIIGEKI
jgi:hypothetical protein